MLGFSYEDIGRVAKMPVGTAKSYVHRGRERLRASVEEQRLEAATAVRSGGQRVVTGPLGRAEIEAIIPHRDPFLLLDEVTEIIPGKRVVARKLVREDEWYLAGHFPGRPIMPGVLMVEAMAQAGAVAVLSEPSNAGKLALFAGINDVRFKRLVTPGRRARARLRARPAARPDRPRRRDGDAWTASWP